MMLTEIILLTSRSAMDGYRCCNDNVQRWNTNSTSYDLKEWSNLTTGAWCYYENNPSNVKLYNWYAINSR